MLGATNLQLFAEDSVRGLDLLGGGFCFFIPRLGEDESMWTCGSTTSQFKMEDEDSCLMKVYLFSKEVIFECSEM